MRRAWPLLVAGLLLVGCSGGDDEEDAAGSTTTSVPPTTVADPADVVSPENEAFCQASGALDEGIPPIDPAVSDPARLEEAFNEAGQTFDQTIESAPEEIRADVEVLAGAFEDLVAALERVDYDFTQLTLQSLTELDAPEVQAAEQSLEAFRTENCAPAD